MARTIIPRNDVGQYEGEVPAAIREKCEGLFTELFTAFPDVDIWDIENIVIKALGWIGSVTLLREAGDKKEETYLYGNAVNYVVHDVIFTQKLLQQSPKATVVGDEINLNIPMYPQIHPDNMDIVKQYDPKKNPNLWLTYFWDVKSGTFKYVGESEKKYTPPHYDEVRALELIRQGVDPEVAYKMCCKETVGPNMKEVSNGNPET